MLSKLKIGIFSLFFLNCIFAQPYVLENQHQLVEKTTGFIEILSDEVYEKTGVRMYVVALEGLNGVNLQEKEQAYLEKLKAPYVLLFFVKAEKKLIFLSVKILKKYLTKKKFIGIILSH